MFGHAHAPHKVSGRLGFSSLTTGNRRVGRRALATLAFVGLLAAPGAAHAQREVRTPMGERGTLAIDQLSGFRASSIGGVTYAGPIGFSIQSFGQTDFSGRGSNTSHYTNFWLAPSADYFVIDHLSIGGLIEIATTSVTVDTTNQAGVTTSVNLPSTTNVTLLPRVGWLFPITERFGIWPRGGIGFASRQTTANNTTFTNGNRDTYSSVIFDVDVGFLYRVNQNWFLRAAPEVSFGVGGTHSQGNNNGSVSASASLFQFAGVAGIGVMWDL